MTKTTWQVIAYLAIGWAALATAVAWINKTEVEAATVRIREPVRAAASVAEAEAAPAVRTAPKVQATVPHPEERCISGTLFRTIDGALTNVGTC